MKDLVTAAGHTEEVVAAVRKRLTERAEGLVGSAWRSRAGALSSPRRRASRVVAVAALFAAAAAALLLSRPRRNPSSPVPEVAQQEAPGAGRSDEAPRPAAAVPPRPILARLEAIEGPAYRHGADGTVRLAPALGADRTAPVAAAPSGAAPVATALELGAGDWVSTSGATTRARIVGPGGTRVELSGDAAAALAADPVGGRVFVSRGRATSVAGAAGGPGLVLASPHAIVTGEASVRLEVGATVTRVEVTQGRARVSGLGVQRHTDVSAGQLALVSADELQPARAQAAREVLLLTGPDGTKEPVPPVGLRISEERLKLRLERLGFQVTVLDAGALTAERARAAALLVLSSSVLSVELGAPFAELPVPMVVLESTGFEQLGLTGSRWRRDVGPAPALAELVITNPTHPLAAGLERHGPRAGLSARDALGRTCPGRHGHRQLRGRA